MSKFEGWDGNAESEDGTSELEDGIVGSEDGTAESEDGTAESWSRPAGNVSRLSVLSVRAIPGSDAWLESCSTGDCFGSWLISGPEVLSKCRLPGFESLEPAGAMIFSGEIDASTAGDVSSIEGTLRPTLLASSDSGEIMVEASGT